LNDRLIEQLGMIVGGARVIADVGEVTGYLYDETPRRPRAGAADEVVITKPRARGRSLRCSNPPMS